MQLRCFWELTSLEKAAIVAAAAIGLGLVAAGFALIFYRGPRQPRIKVWYETELGTISAFLPFPLACLLIGVLCFAGVGGWLAYRFPAENLGFSQKHWTLAEVKERLERESRVRVELKGAAPSFEIDKDFSGACASDLMVSICDYYGPSKLRCERPKPGTFIITAGP